MSCKNTLKSLLKRFDMFSQQVTFRYNEEPAYESLTGGCISLLLIIAFVGIFATTLLRTVDKEYINFNQSRHDEQSPGYFATTLDKTFMFAIGLDGIDATHGERYFDIYMQFRDYNSTHKLKTNMPLQICERSAWQDRGYGEAFDSLNLTRWYCPTQDQRLELQGKFTSQSFKFYKIAVTKCNATLDPTRPCASDATIQAYLNANEAFNFNYYFINTIINPGDDIYLRTYLDDVNYFPFSKTNGVNANLFISSYTIQTDESLWPVEDFQEDEGGIVLDPAQVMNYQVRGKQYLKLYLRKSPISIAITRSFRKVDDTLSYIGGLFSTIIGFLGIVSMYNQLAYEIQISRSSYYYDKNDPFDGDHFNLLTFIPYLLYLFLDIFGIELKWPKLQRLHRYLEQGRKHLDIKLIIKKILYAQKLGLAVLDKSKHKALLLSEPFTLDEADVIRKDLSFYKQCRKKFFPNGELDTQQLTKFGSKKELMSSAVFNEDGIGFSKVYPVPDESIMRQNTDILRQNTFDQKMESNQEMNKQATKSDQDIKIQDEEQFTQLEKQVKLSLMELQAEVEKNDPIAKRIWQNIDPRIKKRYLTLTSSNIPRKLRMSMKLDSSSLKNL